jgi:uncharacterized protein YoxC
MVQSIAKAADLDGTIAELKGVTGSLDEVGQTLSDVNRMVREPLAAAVNAANSTLPATLDQLAQADERAGAKEAAEEAEAQEHAGPAETVEEAEATDRETEEQAGE